MAFEGIVFGIIQGIFEWLPISSQGNLVFLMIALFGYSANEALKFSIFLHTGTLLSVIVYFRKDVKKILSNLRNYRFNFEKDNGLITFLIISTTLTVLVGYPIYKLLAVSSLPGEIFIGIVGIALIITGIIQRFSKAKGLKSEKDLGFKDSIILGIAQGLSIIPGISRSGITISSFLLRGYNSEDSLRLSFLMSIPAILIAEIGLGLFESLPKVNLIDSIAGLGFSFIFGLLLIGILIRIARKIKFWIFCVVIGIIALIPLAFYV
jgi:undecaprenyl-diphosphatase